MTEKMKKQVLVTGTSRGIGRGIALYLANLGYSIIVHYNKNQHKADEVLQLVKERSDGRTISFDVSNRAKTTAAISEDIEQNGAYYAVVCNAGFTDFVPFRIMDGEQWDEMINVNLNSFFNVLKPIVESMVLSHIQGRIVTISSIAGQIGSLGQAHYSASKAGIIGATKSLAVELARNKITVNCIAPGYIETDMLDGIDLEAEKKRIPLKRIGKVDEVASLVAYLLSEDAAYITRQVIGVDGGLLF